MLIISSLQLLSAFFHYKTCKIEMFTLPLQPQTKQGAIAQLVEQRTENPCVPGSIPGGTTLKERELQKCNSLSFHFLIALKTGYNE